MYESTFRFLLLQMQSQLAKPILRHAIEMSQRAPYWHCRLLFQLAVSLVFVVWFFF